MKKVFWRLLIIVAIIGTVLISSLPTGVVSKPIDYTPTDVGPQIREWEATPERIMKKGDSGDEATVATALTPLDSKLFLILNDYLGVYQFTTFYLVAESSATQIWVQANLAWLAEDPRSTPEISQEQVDYILSEFDNVILPTETAFFGSADFHDGNNSLLEAWGYVPPGYYDDATGRQIVLVSNIRDENYYDPTYPLYIAGFYSGAFEDYFDRNVISIDAYDWMNRMGPDASRPFLYEGIFAHEYQHLLHDDYDADEDNFINEGMSEFAEILCGYTPALQGHLDAAASNPENSLVVWGDQGDLEILTDYGQAALFQVYLLQRYGQAYIQALFHDPGNGIEGVNNTLPSGDTFADVYHDFSTAMYMLGSFTLFPDFQVNVGHPGKRNPEAFATPGAPPWGTDYYILWGYERIANFKFNGFQFNPVSWTSDGSALWGGTGDLIDNWAIFETTGGGTLNFDTMYDIEDFWDFGFVQVSTDDGFTWTSLSNGFTTTDHDPSAHPTVVANLPGLTGSSIDWVNMSFDLSAYAGQDILVAFRYVTDWATTYAGWYVDNVYVDDTLISDGSSTDGFISINEVLGISNEYTVTLVGQRTRKGEVNYKVEIILTGDYAADWQSIRNMFDNYSQLIMLVTYDAVPGVTSYADYNFEIDHRGGTHLK